jgi:hypothetical protein
MKNFEFFEYTASIVHAVILWQIIKLLLNQNKNETQNKLKAKPKSKSKTTFKTNSKT